MTIINTSPDRTIQLGYEGEDSVTQIVFAYDDTWTDCGDGVFKIRVLRHGDTVAYNATSVTDDREAKTLTMTITNVELSAQGRGEMQVVYSGTDFVKKSPIYAYYVSRALDGEVSPPEGNIIAEIVESLADITETIGDIQTAVQGKADTQTVSAIADAVNGLDSDVQSLQTAVQSKVDTATVTALSGTVTGLQTSKADKSYVDTQLAEKASAQTVSDLSDDVSDLQTAIQGKADMATVTALSGTVSSLQTTVQSKADAQTVTTLSGTVSSLQTSKADKSYVDTQLAAKASTATATTSTNGLMSAQDKSKLDAVYADYTSALTALGGGS